VLFTSHGTFDTITKQTYAPTQSKSGCPQRRKDESNRPTEGIQKHRRQAAGDVAVEASQTHT